MVEFANEIAELNGTSHMMSECERFGMTWGCREYCPVYERGECELQKENEERFNKQ
jgi:hypothetical protein